MHELTRDSGSSTHNREQALHAPNHTPHLLVDQTLGVAVGTAEQAPGKYPKTF